ncbi:hypothetical protein MHBO_003458 [Bonamia ostreae]|uniref:Charged multivesicular body protein 5 n=1 Tax=Bonamia ostreae TaxID=126728 RepID=A0ABV2AQI3_9EUKA
MNFLGKFRGNKEPKPTLDSSANNLSERDNALFEKIRKLDAEISRYKTQLNNTNTASGKRAIKSRVMRLLKQREVYRKQRDMVLGQQGNIDSVKFTQDSMKDNIELVKAMKTAKKQMSKQVKKLDVDDVADLFDDMADIYIENEEVQNIMSQDCLNSINIFIKTIR